MNPDLVELVKDNDKKWNYTNEDTSEIENNFTYIIQQSIAIWHITFGLKLYYLCDITVITVPKFTNP